jgi:predicted PurR-regulated permease PerM
MAGMLHDRLVRLTLALVAVAAAQLIWGGVLGVLARYGGLLMVFVLGWLLAFILNPVVQWVTHPRLPHRGAPAPEPPRRRIPWGVAVLLVYLGIAVIALVATILIVPRVVDDLSRIVQSLPDLVNRLQAAVLALAQELGLKVAPATIQQGAQATLSQLAAAVAGAVAGLTALIVSVSTMLTNAILVLVFGLYLNLGGGDLLRRVIELLPRRWHDEAWVFSGDVNHSFGGFLRGQVIYAALSAAIVAVAMVLFQVPAVVGVTLLTFLLSLIPLFGSFLGLIPPVLAALTVSTQTAVLMLVILGGIQLVLTNAVMPKIFAGSIRMEPIVVFVAIVVGIGVAGLWGAIFAIPLTALAIATIQYATGRRTDVPPPHLSGPGPGTPA